MFGVTGARVAGRAEPFGQPSVFGSFGAMPKEHKKLHDDAIRKQNKKQEKASRKDARFLRIFSRTAYITLSSA